MSPSSSFRCLVDTPKGRFALALLITAEAYDPHTFRSTRHGATTPRRHAIPDQAPQVGSAERAGRDVRRWRWRVGQDQLWSRIHADRYKAARNPGPDKRRRLGARGRTRVRAERPGRGGFHLDTAWWMSGCQTAQCCDPRSLSYHPQFSHGNDVQQLDERRILLIRQPVSQTRWRLAYAQQSQLAACLQRPRHRHIMICNSMTRHTRQCCQLRFDTCVLKPVSMRMQRYYRARRVSFGVSTSFDSSTLSESCLIPSLTASAE